MLIATFQPSRVNNLRIWCLLKKGHYSKYKYYYTHTSIKETDTTNKTFAESQKMNIRSTTRNIYMIYVSVISANVVLPIQFGVHI
jgi:hypothetical protein